MAARGRRSSAHPSQYAPGVTWTATRELIEDAVTHGSAVAAFNVITLDHAEAIAAGATEAGTAVLLQLSQNAIAYHGAAEPILAACREIAAAATIPVGIHLDHLEDADLVHRILARSAELGVGSLMFDASKLDDDDNVRATSAICRAGQARGLWVEAELGEVGGKDGAHAPGVRTDPEEARRFVEHTGVDGLAVAVGSSHAMRERTAAIDIDLVRRLADAVPVPLVLHGSSGVADAVIARGGAGGDPQGQRRYRAQPGRHRGAAAGPRRTARRGRPAGLRPRRPPGHGRHRRPTLPGHLETGVTARGSAATAQPLNRMSDMSGLFGQPLILR